jgi:serine/threonine protein kinase
VRLIDFGLAWQHDAWSMSLSHSEGGTFAFMAPEQARVDLERIRPLSDVFSIGAVLYFLLTGSGPFAAETAEESWDRARHCKLDRTALKRARVPVPLCCPARAGASRFSTRTLDQIGRGGRRHFCVGRRACADLPSRKPSQSGVSCAACGRYDRTGALESVPVTTPAGHSEY